MRWLLQPGWTEQYITQTCREGSYRKLQGGKSYLRLNKNSKLARNFPPLYPSQPESGGEGLSWPQPSHFSGDWEQMSTVHFFRVGERSGEGVNQEQRFPTLCHDQHIISSSLQLERWADNLAVLHSWAGWNIKHSQEMMYESHSSNRDLAFLTCIS